MGLLPFDKFIIDNRILKDNINHWLLNNHRIVQIKVISPFLEH